MALEDYVRACHGYANACSCERCADRALRVKLNLLDSEVPDPYAAALRESDEYFRRPWLYRLDEETGLHRPLRT